MKIRRLLIAGLLAASMLLTACSGGQSTESSPEPAENTAAPVSSEPAAEPEELPEYSWSSVSVPIEYDEGILQPLCYSGEGFYALSEVKTGELIPDEVIKEAEEKDEEVVNDGRYDVFELRLSFINLEGEIKQLKKYAQLPAAKNSGKWKDFSSTSGLDGLALDEEGKLYALEHTYAAGYSEAEAGEKGDADGMVSRFEEKWYLRRLDPETGRILSKKEIINEDGAFFSGQGMTFRDGRLWLTATGDGGNLITAVNTDGTVERSIECDGYIYRLLTLSDGSLASFGTDSKGELQVCGIDTENYSQKKLYEISDSVENICSGSGDYSFYYTDGLDFCGWSGESGQRMFSWTEVNVNSGRISSDIIMETGGTGRFITAESGGSKLYTITRSPYDSSRERKSVTLASSNPDYCLKDVVADFNSSSSGCRIVITDDFDSADIIDLSGLDYRKLAAQRKIADLYPYIDSDSEISRGDLFSNILVSLEVEGRMCMSFSSFSVETVLGATAVTGERNSWSYDQYYSAADALEEGSRAFDAYTTGYDILETRLAMDSGKYIDWSTGTCSFDSSEFEQLLEFACSVQKSCGGSESGEDYSPDIEIAAGRQMLQRLTLYDFDDVQRAGYEFGQAVSYVGYPGTDGPGSGIHLISTDSGANFAISEKSLNKDEAWQFIRTFFTEEYQSERPCFPTRTGLFNERIEKAMEFEYILDADGNPKLDEDTEEPLIRSVGTMYLSNFREIKYYPLTQPGAAKFSTLVENTKNVMFRNAELTNLINSTVEPYFSGRANVHAAAASVQDAVTRWLENQY